MANDKSVPKFEDTEEIVDVPKFEDTTDANHLSSGEIFQRGAEQGLLFGNADEAAGGIQGAMDKLAQWGIPGILPDNVNKTPNQIVDQLKSQGFTGDGLQSTYESGRDDARAMYKNAQDQSKGEYFAGNIAGGALGMMTPGGIGKMIANPFGKVAEGAGVLKTAGMAALNAAPTGALVGLGTSEADNITDQAIDTAKGAGMGALFGGGLNLAGQGLGAGANKTGEIIEKKLPSLHRAYQKGVEGIKSYSDDFAQQTNDKLMKLTGNVRDFVLEKRNAIMDRNKNLVDINQKLIDTVGKQIDDTTNQLNSYKQSLVDKEAGKASKAGLKYAEQLQNKVLKNKNNIKATYDTIETQLDDADVSFNMNNEIANFGEDLQINGLMPDQAKAIQQRFMPYFEKTELSMPELRQLKMEANKMMQSNNPAIRGAAKKFYGSVNNNQINTIEGQGFKDVAKQLKDTNRRYMQVLDLEDDFIGSLQKDRVLDKTLTNKETIQALENSVKQDAKNTNATNIFQEKLNNFDPATGKMFKGMSDDLASKQQMTQSLKNQDMVGNNAEIQRLQNVVAEAKKAISDINTPPEIKTQMDQLINSSEKQINDYLGNSLKNVAEPLMTPAKQNIENVLESYQKATGKTGVKEQASELVKDMDLVKNAGEEFKGMISPRSIGAIESVGQVPANMAGRVVHNINKYKPSTIKNVFKDDVKNVYQNIKKFNTPESDLYAKQIESITEAGTNSYKKNAVMSSLMQQPGFRKLLNNKENNEK